MEKGKTLEVELYTASNCKTLVYQKLIDEEYLVAVANNDGQNNTISEQALTGSLPSFALATPYHRLHQSRAG